MSIYDGDPRLYLTEDGADLSFTGGQCTMDQGLINLANISLLTEPGFWGNDLVNNSDQKIGSSFLSENRKPITLQNLRNVEQAAKKALNDPAFGEVTVEATNPKHWRKNITTLIKPPGADTQEIVLSANGQNWINQAAMGDGTI